jgi:hypothetical protein
MVPLALPQGEHVRNPKDREQRAVRVSPEAVTATSRNLAIRSARGPRLGSSLCPAVLTGRRRSYRPHNRTVELANGDFGPRKDLMAERA